MRAARGARWATLGLGLVLALATGAQAAPPTVKLTISRPDGVKLVPPVAGGAAAARPELEVEQVLVLPGQLDGPIRAEQEQILADLIAGTADAEVDEKGNYYFMLGELYAKQHRHWRQESVELAARAGETQDAKVKAEAAAATAKAEQYLMKTVKTYKGLTENEALRNYTRMDLVLFHLAYTLRSGGHALEARQVFDKLLKNYPNSKHAAGAYLLVGDHLFQSGQLTDAEHQYKIVLKYPTSAAYWYAMYKLGWVHLGSRRFPDALETFNQVAQGTKSDPKWEGLNRAALRDYARVYAEIGKPEKANPAFQRVDDKKAVEMLERLADLYLEQGKSDNAIFVYQELLKTAPANQNACSWQYNIALAATYSTGKARAVELCARDVPRFKAWARTDGVRVVCADCWQDSKVP